MHKSRILKAGLLFIVLVCSLFILTNMVSAGDSSDFEDFESGWGDYLEFGNGIRSDNDNIVIDGDWSVYCYDDDSDYIYHSTFNSSGYDRMRVDFYFKFYGDFEYDEVWEFFFYNSSGFISVKQYSLDGVNYTDDVVYNDTIWLNFSDYDSAGDCTFGWQGVSFGRTGEYWSIDNVSFSLYDDFYQEDYEDEAVGAEPWSDWYVIDDSGGAVDNGDSFDGSQSYYFDDNGDNFNIYFNNISDDDIVVDWWMKKGVSSDDDFFAVNMYNYSLDSLLNLRIQDEGDNSVIYENDSGEQDTNIILQNDVWYNYIVRINFTAHKYHFLMHRYQGGDIYQNIVKEMTIDMINDCDNLRFISFIGWNNSYLDNLSIYQGYSIEGAPHPDIANGTTGVDPFNIILKYNISDLNFDIGYDYTGKYTNTLKFYMLRIGGSVVPDEVGSFVFDGFGLTENTTISCDASSNYSGDLSYNGHYIWYVTQTFSDKHGFTVGSAIDDGGVYVDFLGFYCYEFYTEENENATVTSSICGTTISNSTWKTNHTPCFAFSDPEGDRFSVNMVIYAEETYDGICADIGGWNVENCAMGLWCGNCGEGTDKYYAPLHNITNSTVCIDISDAVPWNNMNYSIKFVFYEENKDPDSDWYVEWCNFSIGTYEDKTWYIGVRNLKPAHHDENAYDIIGSKDNLGFEITSNFHNQPIVFALAHYNTLDNGTRMLVFKQGPSMAYIWSNFYLGNILSNYITIRESYTMFVGVSSDDFSVANLEFSHLYDDCNDVGFTYSHDTFWSIVYGFGEATADYNGISWTFHTFPEGEDPWSDIDPHQEDYGDQTLPGKIGDVEDELNIGYLGLLGALILIVVFSFMPIIAQYTVFKDRYKKSVPISVQLSFTLFGVILAFEFGFIPLWTIALGFAIVGIAITFKLFTWFKSRSPIDLNTGGKGDV